MSACFPSFKRLLGVAALAFTGLALAAGPTETPAAFPDKMVRLVVGFPAGGPSDVLTRQFAPTLEKELGVSVIVENVGGAGGTIAANRVLRSPANGYQVLVGSPMELIQAPISMAGVNFVPHDFQLTGMIINTDVVMVGRKGLPYNTVDQLIEASKSPDYEPLKYGSVGHGSMFHLAGEYFATQSGAEFLHVPYRGAGPIIQGLMGGEIDIAFIPLVGQVLSLIEGGQIKALGLAGPERHPLLPELPLISESAAIDDFSFDIWAALTVPKDTPDAVMNVLNDAMASTLEQAELKKTLEANGTRVSPKRSIDEQAQFYSEEAERYQRIAKLVGVEPQ